MSLWGSGSEQQLVVRVLPDEPALAKTFDYVLPDKFGGDVRVGTRVRVPLGNRRVGGWVVATGVEPPPDVKLRPVAKLSGLGPSQDLIDLAHWAAWRWAGQPASFLRTASPKRVVDSLPAPAARPVGPELPPDRVREMVRHVLGQGGGVLRLPPAADLVTAGAAASVAGNALVLCPTLPLAHAVARALHRAKVPVAIHPSGWAAGAAGATVVGTRAAAWAPVGDLAAVMVLDEHDEAHAQEQAPTWNARDVAIERARRAGVPCMLVSPCPSLEAQAWARAGTDPAEMAGRPVERRDPYRVVAPSKADERAGWPIVDVADRREDDPRTGLFSPRLVETIRRRSGRVVCVLNRTGRARLLACAACGELATCESCTATVVQAQRGELTCPRCGVTRPVLCASCGGMKLKVLRQGVNRVREELEALLDEPVGELTSASPRAEGLRWRVVVGTEAVLHQLDRAEVVAFLDFDQELLAPRYRAVEQATSLLIRAARLVGGRGSGGRLVLQTRLPRHEVVVAALHGDPTRVSRAEAERREVLQFPPVTAMAEVSGAVAEEFVSGVEKQLGVEVMGPADGRWLVRAPDHRTLCDALAATPRPSGRLRVAVDPLRV